MRKLRTDTQHAHLLVAAGCRLDVYRSPPTTVFLSIAPHSAPCFSSGEKREGRELTEPFAPPRPLSSHPPLTTTVASGRPDPLLLPPLTTSKQHQLQASPRATFFYPRGWTRPLPRLEPARGCRGLETTSNLGRRNGQALVVPPASSSSSFPFPVCVRVFSSLSPVLFSPPLNIGTLSAASRDSLALLVAASGATIAHTLCTRNKRICRASRFRAGASPTR